MSTINQSSTGTAIYSGHSFRTFVFGVRANWKLLWIALTGSIVQLIIFKLCYPFPDFISDSYNYIESAANNLNVNLWPIGYAKFLAFVHQINYSDTLLVAIQYFLLQSSLLYFFYTIKYLYRPPALTTRILFIVILFNPLSLYLSNCVLSDALFTTITVIWISILLWQLQFPSRSGMALQVVLMGMAFTLRYTAMYYPLVAAIAILLYNMRPWEKIAWIIAPTVLFIPFMRFTQLQTQAVTGTPEFSVFGGWQIANNALYMYRHIQVDSTKLPPDMRKLDRMVRQYYKWAPAGYFDFDDFPGTFFIKHSDAPLKQYMWRHYPENDGFRSWGKVSPMYNKYGTFLITHYPLAFAQYYLLLNTKNYFYPHLEKFDVYNLHEDTVWHEAREWFHYPTPQVRSVSNSFQGILFFGYPSAFLLMNVFYLGCLLWLGITRKYRELDPVLQKALWLLTGFWVINFGFSILATPVVLRYQVVPMLLLFTFSLLLLEFIDFKKLRHA